MVGTFETFDDNLHQIVEEAVSLLSRFLANEDGATAIEYALIATGIALAIITMVGLTGTEIQGLFTDIKTEFEGLGGG